MSRKRTTSALGLVSFPFEHALSNIRRSSDWGVDRPRCLVIFSSHVTDRLARIHKDAVIGKVQIKRASYADVACDSHESARQSHERSDNTSVGKECVSR